MGRYSWSILSPIWKFFDVISHPICSCTFQETIFNFVHSRAQNLYKQFQSSFFHWQGQHRVHSKPIMSTNDAWSPQNWSLLDASVQKIASFAAFDSRPLDHRRVNTLKVLWGDQSIKSTVRYLLRCYSRTLRSVGGRCWTKSGAKIKLLTFLRLCVL